MWRIRWLDDIHWVLRERNVKGDLYVCETVVMLPFVYFNEVLLDDLADANQLETNPAYRYMGKLLSVTLLLIEVRLVMTLSLKDGDLGTPCGSSCSLRGYRLLPRQAD